MLRLNNPLGYPGGQPSINWAHPASANLRWSAVATGITFRSLNYAPKLTVGATPFTAAVDGNLGPVTVGSASTGQYVSRSSGYPAHTDNAGGTMAAIVRLTSVSVAGSFCGVSNSYLLRTTAAGAVQFGVSGISFTTLMTLSANVPYFIAASSGPSGGKINCVAVNLNTGKIQTATASAIVPTSNSAAQYMAGASGAASPTGSIAATMFSATPLSMPQLLAWAKAPWDFWYPPTLANLLTASLAKLASGTQYNKSLSISTTSAVTAIKAVAAARSLSSSSAVAATKAIGAIRAISSASAVSAAKVVSAVRAISTTSTVAAAKAISAVRAISTVSAVSATKAVAATKSISSTSAVSAAAHAIRVCVVAISATSAVSVASSLIAAIVAGAAKFPGLNTLTNYVQFKRPGPANTVTNYPKFKPPLTL